MQRLEVRGAIRPIYESLGVKRLSNHKISGILWNPGVRDRVHKTSLLFPIQSQMNYVHSPPFHYINTYFNIIVLLTAKTRKPRRPTKSCTFKIAQY